MTADRSLRPAIRTLAATAGALSAFSLAGCSEPNTGPALGADAGSTPPAGGTDATGADAGGAPTGGTPSPAEPGCDEDAVAALADERAELEGELVELEYELASLRTAERGADYLLGQLESGFPEQTAARGKAVGIAARASVVVLQIVEGGYPANHATAWFVDDGYLFTNAHNVSPAGPDTEYRAVTPDGERFDVEVVDVVEGMVPDVALLRTGYRGADPLPLAAVDELEPGQPLVQVGHPGEIGYWIVSMGRFVEGQQTRTVEGDPYTALKSVVPGRPGVSGSPVLTLDGGVVGMTNGGESVVTRDPGTPAPAAPEIVFDGPIGDVAISLHDGSDVLARKLEDWR